MSATSYTIAFEDGRSAEVTVEHGGGADNTWASGLLFDPHGVIQKRTAPIRYLGYDCDTEIVATVIGTKLDESLTSGIWQTLEGQMPDCRCEDEDDQYKKQER